MRIKNRGFYTIKNVMFLLAINCFLKWLLFVFINIITKLIRMETTMKMVSYIVHLYQKSLVNKLRLNQFVREELKFIVHFPLMHHLLKCSCDISKIFSTVKNRFVPLSLTSYICRPTYNYKIYCTAS